MIQRIKNIIKYCLNFVGSLIKSLSSNRFVFKKNKNTKFKKNKIGEKSKIIVNKNDGCEICDNDFR